MLLDSSHQNVDIESDALFLAQIGFSPAKLDPPRISLDVIVKNTTKPCAWTRNPQFWSCALPLFPGKGHPQTIRRSNPQFWSSMALNLRSGREHKIIRMISIFRRISKSGATAVRAQSLTLYAPPRDSIAIPAPLMRGDFQNMQHLPATVNVFLYHAPLSSIKYFEKCV